MRPLGYDIVKYVAQQVQGVLHDDVSRIKSQMSEIAYETVYFGWAFFLRGVGQRVGCVVKVKLCVQLDTHSKTPSVQTMCRYGFPWEQQQGSACHEDAADH